MDRKLERALSSRRSPSHAARASESGDGGGDDDSKNRKHGAVAGRFANLVRVARTYSGNLLLLFALLLAGAFFLSWAPLPPPAVVCVSPYHSAARNALVGADLVGLASDFGVLGVPWCRAKHDRTVEWTPKDLLNGLQEFVPIYETRPIQDSNHIGFDHSFGLWFMARWLKPDLMIESGAYRGYSTWILRQAMPATRIISIVPVHPDKHLNEGPSYVDENCTYFSGSDFVDFGSVDWNNVMSKHGISDFSRVLLFFDDHQNQLKRLKQALSAGFQHLIFEDNYDTGTGDHYTLRQICDQYYIRGGGHSCFRDSDEARTRAKRKMLWEKAVDTPELCGKEGAWWGVQGYMRDNFNSSNKAVSYKQHFQNSRFVESVLDIYWELPPVAGPSLTHQIRYDPARTQEPIVEDGKFHLFKKLGLARLEASLFNQYTQMVYIKVSAPPLTGT
ncbi:hypothetical protein Cni_G06630 [Canna indica]|uniref:Uncharacterized protein n=1 Tax=Canna indica TaxID=4628 RepID=A0AAQ3JZN7_9LILI|nr:hypothetical protein Cni_G06630 [Canna indica]